jgi:hypothetical protein
MLNFTYEDDIKIKNKHVAGAVLRIRDVLPRIPDPDPSICSSRISDPVA